MGSSNRDKRRKKEEKRKKERAKSKAPRSPESERQNILDSMSTDLTVNSIRDQAGQLPLAYSLLRTLGLSNHSLVWTANKDILELCLFGNKPKPWAAADLKQVCSTFDAHIPFDYSDLLRKIDTFVRVENWDDQTNPLIEHYKSLPIEEVSSIDFPVIMHFYAKGWLGSENDPVQECMEYILFWFETERLPLSNHLVPFFRDTKKWPLARTLKGIDLGLKNLEKRQPQLAQSPEFLSFIEPSLRSLFHIRLGKESHDKLEKYPNIVTFLKGTPTKFTTLADQSLDLRINFEKLSAEQLDYIKSVKTTLPNTFEQHIRLLLLEWRGFVMSNVSRPQNSTASQQFEKVAFLSLWSALSRGIPDSKRDYASRAKDLCLDFFLDCMIKFPRYRPDPAVIDALAVHNPQNEMLIWLQIAKANPTQSKTHATRLPQRPKALPFDLFYSLYEHYNLNSKPIFIERYFDALPIEAKREILLPWFRRLMHSQYESETKFLVIKNTFGKLLKADRFPVSELGTDAELEDFLVFWSLAFKVCSGLDVGNLSYKRLISVLATIQQTENVKFWVDFGEPVLFKILSEILSPENIKRGTMDPLIAALKHHKSARIIKDIKYLREEAVMLADLASEWNKLTCVINPPERAKKSPANSPKKKTKSKPNKKKFEELRL